MTKIKILGFPGNGLLTNTLLIKALFHNSEGIPFTMPECMQLIESKQPIFQASLKDMVINRTADTITVFEDGKNETVALQWCEVVELAGNEAHAADMLQSTEANVIHTADYMHNTVKRCISVLQSYLPPDGISDKDAISELLGILDNAEIVKELKDAEKLFS